MSKSHDILEKPPFAILLKECDMPFCPFDLLFNGLSRSLLHLCARVSSSVLFCNSVTVLSQFCLGNCKVCRNNQVTFILIF